jgi:DNA-binding GntR family transcriptional regulator
MPPGRRPESNPVLSDLAYEQVRQMVLTGVVPRDKRISETKLGKELGYSRTPVREAIQRLAREGLLIQRPSSGTYIVKPEQREIKDIYEVRLALETMAASHAAKRMSDKHINQLNHCVEKMIRAIRTFRKTGKDVLQGKELTQYHAADEKFHQLILQAAGNKFAQSIISQGHVKQFIFGHQSHHRNLHHLAWLWLKHAQLARAIAKHDANDARRRMNRLIKASMRDALSQAKSKMP